MAHYAFIDSNNVVVEVIVGRNENEVVDGISDWEQHYAEFRPGLRALRTSYNTLQGIYYDPVSNQPSQDQSKAFRGNYASIGYTYDEDLDAFLPPQPYPSWILDEATFSWVAPVPYPGEGVFVWDEEAGDWVEVEA